MNKGELIYLASPYSHLNDSVKQERFESVNKVAAKLMSDGFYIFSPISHTRPIEIAGNLPGDWKYWEGYDRAIISACKGLMVLKLSGWETSIGVNAEINIAKELTIPIEYIEYNDF